MLSKELKRFYDERFSEIQEYLVFLKDLDDASRSGAPKITGTNSSISASQVSILNSSLYLQLYNLVEATVQRCLEGVAAAVEQAKRTPKDLSIELRKEWVMSVAKTQTDLTPKNRLKATLEMCEHLLEQIPIKDFRIDKGGGGSWDDESIHKLANRVGCSWSFSDDVMRAVKIPVRDNMGALKLVKDRRNSLAHGRLSFVDCSTEVTFRELERMSNSIGEYLGEVIRTFTTFIEEDILEKR